MAIQNFSICPSVFCPPFLTDLPAVTDRLNPDIMLLLTCLSLFNVNFLSHLSDGKVVWIAHRRRINETAVSGWNKMELIPNRNRRLLFDYLRDQWENFMTAAVTEGNLHLLRAGRRENEWRTTEPSFSPGNIEMSRIIAFFTELCTRRKNAT